MLRVRPPIFSTTSLCPVPNTAHERFTAGTAVICDGLTCAALDEDSYTKEQTKSAKFVSLVHAVSMGTPAAKAAAVAAQHALAPTRLASAASISTLDGLESEQDSLQVGWQYTVKSWVDGGSRRCTSIGATAQAQVCKHSRPSSRDVGCRTGVRHLACHAV